MKSLVLCLGSLREPRVHAGLRRDFPLLYVVPFLVAGQLAASVSGMWTIWPALAALPCARRAAMWRAAILCFGAGVLTVGLSQPSRPMQLPTQAETVMAIVTSEPRHPRVGEVKFEAEMAPPGGTRPGTIRTFCSAIDLPWRSASKIHKGGAILVRARFKALRAGGSPFSFAATLRRNGMQATCKVDALKIWRPAPAPLRERFLAALKADVYSVLGDGERAGLILSMGLGVRDVLSERTEIAFKITGLAHLLVVSGYQVTMVYGSLYFLLRLLLQRIKRLIVIRWFRGFLGWLAFALTMIFVYAVGIEGSTLRAGLALLFCLIARQLERRGGMLNGILASLAIISIIWPGAIFEPGVELTYAALSGIALGARSRRSFLLSALSVTFFATAATALVSLLWFGSLSVAGFLLNPVLAPLLGFISCEGGFLAIALHAAGVDGAGRLLFLVAGALEAGRDMVLRASQIPFASIQPTGGYLALTAAALAAILLGRALFKLNQYVIASGLD